MQISEFVEATSRIEQYYGKEYTIEQREIMYDELKNLTIDRYRQLVSAVIRKCEFKPKIVDFINADMDLPQTKEEKEEVKEECEKCKSLGYVIYKKTVDDGGRKIEHVYAARCNCLNGQEKSQLVPTLDSIKQDYLHSKRENG